VAVAIWDGIFVSLAYLFVLPISSVFIDPRFLFVYIVDAPAVLVPVLVGAHKRRELRRALASLPAYFVVRIINSALMLEALVSEVVRRRPLVVFEKGHP
jgi:hypothetical protein